MLNKNVLLYFTFLRNFWTICKLASIIFFYLINEIYPQKRTFKCIVQCPLTHSEMFFFLLLSVNNHFITLRNSNALCTLCTNTWFWQFPLFNLRILRQCLIKLLISCKCCCAVKGMRFVRWRWTEKVLHFRHMIPTFPKSIYNSGKIKKNLTGWLFFRVIWGREGCSHIVLI